MPPLEFVKGGQNNFKGGGGGGGGGGGCEVPWGGRPKNAEK